ncbi:hypothetical protein [Leifsonia sp. fls2-241-R2A-40a]|uniref:hypothetical protein n=1 Tax=Leifsonia sp. fls2-241-R2A-40a TaxID=3040290 RepID=UPI00254F17EC|nr:hypothetical protein [Leifsonia sp. fls2-241-R2A-40a]
MTDPSTRRPVYWRNFAWVMTVGAALMFGAGIFGVVIGGATGWLNIGLGVIFTVQAVVNFRQYERAKRQQGGE